MSPPCGRVEYCLGMCHIYLQPHFTSSAQAEGGTISRDLKKRKTGRLNHVNQQDKPTIVSVLVSYSQTQQPVQSLLLVLDLEGTVHILQVLHTKTHTHSCHVWTFLE